MPNKPNPFDLDALDFEPERDTRKWWTRTRKDPMNIGGTDLPGLFRIDNFTNDSIWFVLVLICEAVGLANIVSELDSFRAAFIVSAICFIIDIGLAISHHLFTMGINCINKNNIIIADLIAEDFLRTNNQAITANAINQRSNMFKIQYESEIKKRERIARWLISPCIWIFAVLKIGAFFILHEINIDTATLLIVLTYFVAAYIHIFHTGYFLSGWRCRSVMNSSIKEFVNGQLPIANIIQAGEPNHYEFIVTDALLPAGATDRFHRIELIPSEQYEELVRAGKLNNEQSQELQQGKRLYSFRTHGILSDGALQRLAKQATNPAATREILLNGLYIQSKML